MPFIFCELTFPERESLFSKFKFMAMSTSKAKYCLTLDSSISLSRTKSWYKRTSKYFIRRKWLSRVLANSRSFCLSIAGTMSDNKA